MKGNRQGQVGFTCWVPVTCDEVTSNCEWKLFNGTIYHHLIESVQFLERITGKTEKLFEDLHTAKPL